MIPEAKLQPDKEGQEFGNFCFKEIEQPGEILPNNLIPYTEQVENINIMLDGEAMKEVKLPLKMSQCVELQKHDAESRKIVNDTRQGWTTAKKRY